MKLGVTPPLRQSGDIDNSAGIKILSQDKEIEIQQESSLRKRIFI